MSCSCSAVLRTAHRCQRAACPTLTAAVQGPPRALQRHFDGECDAVRRCAASWLVWKLADWYSRVQQRAGLLRQHGSRACHVHFYCPQDSAPCGYMRSQTCCMRSWLPSKRAEAASGTPECVNNRTTSRPPIVLQGRSGWTCLVCHTKKPLSTSEGPSFMPKDCICELHSSCTPRCTWPGSTFNSLGGDT